MKIATPRIERRINRLTVLMVAVFSCLLIGFVASAAAQDTSGDLVGTVRDASGAVVPTATVTATNTATGIAQTTKTNSSGEYRISNLPAGFYNISAEAQNFSKTVLEREQVQLNKTVTGDLTLRAGTSSTVEVTAEAAVSLDTTTSQLQNTFDAKEVQDLPTSSTGFGVLNLAFLSPGVGSSGGTGIGVGPSIGGQRPQNNDFTVEGVDNNDKTVSGPLLYIPNDSVSEFTLLTNVYSAEFGHSDAGHFNTIVTSGTNKFHGRAYEYFRNRDLNAIDFATARGAAPGTAPTNPRYDNNRFGGQIGGPVIKDRLFFFGAYERNPLGQSSVPNTFCSFTAAGISTLQGYPGLSANNVLGLTKYAPVATANADPGGAAGCPTLDDGTPGELLNPDDPTSAVAMGAYSVSGPNYINNDALVTSMDWTISQKDNFRGRYIYNLSDGIDTNAFLPQFWGPQPHRYHLAALSEFHNFTPSLTNEVRAGYSRYYNVVAAFTPGGANFPGLNNFPNIQLNEMNLQIGPDPNAPQGGVQNTYQLVDIVSYIKGKHTLKFGFDGRKYISPQSFTQRVRGDYEYNSLSLYATDGVPDALGERDATPTGAIPTDYGDATVFSGFVQDDFRITPKFTANLGIRYDFQSIPFVTKQQALNAAASVPGVVIFKKPEPQKKNFGPRIGFAYAPDSKTSIRAGFALSYDQIRDNLAENTAPPDVAVTIDVNANTPAPFLASGGLPAIASFNSVAERRDASTSYSPDQHVPYSESWTLSLQHVFGQNYTAEVRYLGDRGIHLVTQDRINRQNIVTPSFYLPTFVQAPSAAQIASLTTTLAQMNAANKAGAGFVPAFYNAGFGTKNMVSYDYNGYSNYNGLSGQLTRRFQGGLLLNAAYTYSKTMDNSTDDVFATVLTPRRGQDFRNPGADYSRSALDHTHRFSFAAVYDLPFFKNGNFLERNLLSNWEAAPIYTYESPEYATPQSGIDANLNGDTAGDRVIINPQGKKGTGSDATPVKNAAGDTVGYQAVDPTAYYIRARTGALATSGRNILPTRPINNVDLTALKRIAITERYNVEFQAQAYNVFNHPQFTPGSINDVGPVATTGVQNYLKPGNVQFNDPTTVFSSHPRAMQLVLKFIF